MSPKAVIRPATPADVPDVLRLIRALAEYEHLLHEVTATQDALQAVLFGPVPQAYAVLAEVDTATVGLALFYHTLSTFTLRRNIFLEDLFVEPAHRGTGLGLALMRHLARQAVDGNYDRIEWRVLNWNQPSIDFYRRLGAKPIDDWNTKQLSGDALVALAKGATHG